MRSQRGFTLVELLTGVAISSIIMLAIAAAVIGISGAYSNESQTRSAVEGGRTALTFMEKHVKMAGYGIDPRYAFDFTQPVGLSSAADKDNYPLGTTGFFTDDLAFRYRDPAFVRRGAAGWSETNFVASQDFGRTFPVGTAFMIACRSGKPRSWFRSTAVSGANTLALAPYGTANNAPPAETLTCAGQAGDDAPYLFLIKELRFRLYSDNSTGRDRGYLVYIPNLSADVSSFPASAEVLTADVEEFQVSYQMNRPAPAPISAYSTLTPPDGSTGNWVMLDQPGETTLPNPVLPAPTYETDYDAPLRYSAHPANIRAVRVTFSVRSPRPRQGAPTGYVRGDQENRTGGPTTGDGFFRSWVTSAIRTPNMSSRFFFLPANANGA